MIITVKNINGLSLCLLILSLVAVIGLTYSRYLANTGTVSELSKAPKFLINNEKRILISLGIALAITILSVILTWGLAGSVVVYDAKARKRLKEFIHEAKRRFETAIPFERAVLFIGSRYCFRIDDDAKKAFFGIDKEEKDLLDFKFDGLPSRRYESEYKRRDFMDALPEGPTGSRFLRIKVIRYQEDCAGCLWTRKVYVELPPQGQLGFYAKGGY